MRPLFFPRPLAALAVVALFAAAPLSLEAQQPPAKPAAPNLFGDTSGFEKSTVQENLWDGVNSDGSLAGFTFSAEVVTEKAAFGKLAMPPSVAFVDLNGDGKPDLVTADPTGFFRFYPNSGTATAPKFTSAEIMPFFVSPSRDERNNTNNDETRYCPRFALADWRKTGLLDFMIGNYYGEVLFLPNTGTARQPLYRWPGSIDRLLVQTSDQGRYWANLISPVAYDWNNRGRLDLITGEGTYSANTVHLLENVGDGSVPKFTNLNGKHTYLAYGDGREQLIPTVVDFNGDGKPDLVVADRTGEVGVYLNTGKPGEELRRASTITFGSTAKLPGLCSLFAADYNGDGLFDLLIGLPNGHIAVSLNTGTKTEPKFGPPQDIKGEDRLKREVRAPDGWSLYLSQNNGNAFAYGNVVTNASDAGSNPPEGAACLKLGYWPTSQPTFPMPADGIPNTPRHIVLNHKSMTVEIGKHYRFSFKTRGIATEKLRWDFGAYYRGAPGGSKVERDERGGVKRTGIIEESQHYGKDFGATNAWALVQGEFTPKWKHQELAGEKTMGLSFSVDFWAKDLTGTLYVDDFQLSEAP